MLFNSYEFIFVFLPIALAIFFLIGRASTKIALGWLVVASLAFYAAWNPRYLVLLSGSIAFNYLVGRLLDRPSFAQTVRRGLLLVGVVSNLGLLGYFKYAGFFAESFSKLTGTGTEIPPIVLPLAISFFTFQQIAYLVDTYSGRCAEHSFIDYCLFVTFFPQLIAGPIVHHGEMLPQFRRRDVFRPNADNLAVGLTIFSMGLFKKVVIADGVAIFANVVFNHAAGGETIGLLHAWVGVVAYALQLYFDFSGYSDMAIGLGRLLGIHLPLNFNSPYKATNIVDFWRRWHITLSRFLRDYLYIPLGGSRRGLSRRYANLMTTMLLGGLWHGAGWTFVFWGGLHGLYLCVNHGWLKWCKRADWQFTHYRSWQPVAWTITFVSVLIGWVYFRAASFAVANSIMASMFGLNGFDLDVKGSKQILYVLAVLAAAVWLPNTQQIMDRHSPCFDWDQLRDDASPVPSRLAWLRWNPGTLSAALTATAAALGVLSLTRVQEFLYFQF